MSDTSGLVLCFNSLFIIFLIISSRLSFKLFYCSFFFLQELKCLFTLSLLEKLLNKLPEKEILNDNVVCCDNCNGYANKC